MKINSMSVITIKDNLATPPKNKTKAEFAECLTKELREAEESKDCLAKIQQELVDLKALLSQITDIKTKKDVS